MFDEKTKAYWSQSQSEKVVEGENEQAIGFMYDQLEKERKDREADDKKFFKRVENWDDEVKNKQDRPKFDLTKTNQVLEDVGNCIDKTKGAKFSSSPPCGYQIVGIEQYDGKLIVATKVGIYVMDGGVMKSVMFENKEVNND